MTDNILDILDRDFRANLDNMTTQARHRLWDFMAAESIISLDEVPQRIIDTMGSNYIDEIDREFERAGYEKAFPEDASAYCYTCGYIYASNPGVSFKVSLPRSLPGPRPALPPSRP